MLFSSPLFLQIFLPLLLFLYFLVFRSIRAKNHLLLAASLLFYAWGEPVNILLLMGSVIGNYALACIALRADCTRSVRRIGIIIGVTGNLLLLAVYKYFVPICGFWDRIIGFESSPPAFGLPLGISFFTFQIISYLLDTYRNINSPQRNLEKLALFVSLFPQLVAGPIIKYHDIEAELSFRTIVIGEVAAGIRRFILGLSKKVLLANTMAVVADEIFGMSFEQMDTPTAWTGALCYSLQIYFDFSGYSDMAIGLGRIFGFHFPENFDFPYCSSSIKEFWRRWHISLSSWFKEYLYIPLGGNRCSLVRNSMNVMIVFAVTGIWHGAAFNFVLWGLLYGGLIVAENLFLGRLLERNPFKILNRVYTMFWVVAAWVLFRAESVGEAGQYLGKMLIPQYNPGLHPFQLFTPCFAVLFVVAVFLSAPVRSMFPGFTDQWRFRPVRWWEVPICAILLAIVIIMVSGNTYNPFIYFRF